MHKDYCEIDIISHYLFEWVLLNARLFYYYYFSVIIIRFLIIILQHIRLLQQIRKCMHRRKTMKKIEVALAPYTPYLNIVALWCFQWLLLLLRRNEGDRFLLFQIFWPHTVWVSTAGGQCFTIDKNKY